MPIYEYRCRECGAEKEILQRISDAPLIECPACGKRALVKLVSAAGFQLKGTGWYATDFKNQGAKPAAKGGEKAEKSEKSDKPAEGGKPAESATKEAAKTESAAPAPTKTTTEKA